MHFFGYKTKHKQEISHKNFMQEIVSSQISEVQNPNMSISDKFKLPEMHPTPRGPKQDTPDRLSGNLTHTNWKKLLLVGKVSSVMPDSVKWRSSHKMRSETRCICKFCVVQLHKRS